MPQAFDNCIKNGGKVRRISGPNKRWGLKAGQYVNICILDGKVYRGYVHTKKQGDMAEKMGVKI